VPRLLLTGFPGFLATGLLPRILRDRPDVGALALVEPRMRRAAQARLATLEGRWPGLKPRVELIEGDITLSRMAWDPPTVAALADVTEFFHLAAAYDLDLAADVGERVNVVGTRSVLDLCAELPALERLHYVSTCYVSGRCPGIFTEDDLERGRNFNNHYEETKHRAEIEVRRRMAEGLPATIYRPAAVVGDSDTGATEKFDGPYFVIRFLLRQPRWAVLPVVGDVTENRVNVAPRDFIVDAMAWLSRLDRSLGMTYQLADPAPPTNRWMLDAMAQAAGRRVLKLRLPSAVAKWALRTIPPVRKWMGVPPGGIGYFTHPTRYDTANARRDLDGSGIVCPPMKSYLDRLVAFAASVPLDEEPPGALPSG